MKLLDLNLLMITLSQLDTVKTIKQVFLDVLREFYPSINFQYEESGSGIPIQTLTKQFGFLKIEPFPDEAALGSALHNAVSLLALILENRQQRLLLERSLEEKDFLINRVVDESPSLIYIYNLQNKRNEYINRALNHFLVGKGNEMEVKKEGILNRIIHPDDLSRIAEHHRKLSRQESDQVVSISYRLKNYQGEWHWVESLDIPHQRDEEGRVLSILGNATDINCLRDYQEMIQRNLKEKEVLLREIHHRVKNNMQIMISLLNLQENQMETENDRLCLRESERQIRIMARVHQKLYESDDLSSIKPQEYFASLVYEYRDLLGKNIDLTIDIEDVLFEVSMLLPVALIVNEWVLNSLKHGFNSGESGSIRLEGRHSAEGFRLIYEDSGRGLPEKFSLTEGGGLGSQLILSLVDQLEAELEYSKREGGVRFTLLLPLKEKV